MADPLLVNELEDELLRDQFNDLLEAMEGITIFDPNREEGAYDALNQRIHRAITNKPILARIVNERRNRSFLTVAVSHLNLESSHRVIKCLIQAYPSALLGSPYRVPPIFVIARHPEHCVLMPWIASNYTWILDDERCIQVVFELIRMYVQRQRTSCTSTTIKDFFEAYPQAFTLQDPNGNNVLHKILRLHDDYQIECEVDLFKWIAGRCPSSIFLETNSQGYTLLYLACVLLFNHKGPDSSEICKYLIVKCPASVRIFNDNYDEDVLPIHLLEENNCGYRVVREVVVCLLQEYPESYDMPAGESVDRLESPPPSSIPFIQSIKPYLDEEKELKETAASLTNSSSSLTEAVACTNDQLMRSAFTVFDSWTTSFINSTEEKLQLVSTQLQDMCNEGR